MYFLHDNFVRTALARQHFVQRLLLRAKQASAPSSGAARHPLPLLSLCDIFPRPGEICPDRGKAYAPAPFQEAGNALTSKKGLLHQMPCSSPLYRYKENLSDSP